MDAVRLAQVMLLPSMSPDPATDTLRLPVQVMLSASMSPEPATDTFRLSVFSPLANSTLPEPATEMLLSVSEETRISSLL